MITIDKGVVDAAREGNRAALQNLIRAIQRPIYNVALRMLANPADADDAAQEIVIKIITNLGGLRDTGAAGGWALRVAMRHLVHQRRKGRVEAMRLSFRSFGVDLMDGLSDIPDDQSPDPMRQVLAAQVKIGCTMALLTCLSRSLRAAYILGEIYELADGEAASVLEIAPAAYRQRLARARAMVMAFTQRFCGVAAADAPCQCARRVDKALATYRVQRETCAPEAKSHDLAEIKKAIAVLEQNRSAAALMRSNPEFGWKARFPDLLEIPPDPFGRLSND